LSYGNLVELYGRLKHGSTSEVSAIIEQIKSRDEILDMSEHKGRLAQSVDCPPLAADATGSVDGDGKINDGPAALSGRKASLALDQTLGITSSCQCTSSYTGSIDSALSDGHNGYPSNSPTTRPNATISRTIGTNAKRQFAVGFSPEYESLLTGLLSSNAAKVRQGFTILQSWNCEIRKIHNTEQFDLLFSFLSRGEDPSIPRSRLCEMCALAATSGQYVRHLLAPGLINYWYGKFSSEVLVSRKDQVWLRFFPDATVYFFEECNQVAPESAAKVSTLLSLFGLLDELIGCGVLRWTHSIIW
jgi:hypothetical protein